MRRQQELDEAVSMLLKLTESKGSKLVQRSRIRNLCRELKNTEPTSRKRLVQLIREISQVLCEAVLKEEREIRDRKTE